MSFVRMIVLAAVLALTGAGFAAAGSPDPGVSYRLSPVYEGARLTALSVSIRLQADANGTVTLRLPDSYARGIEFWRNVRDLKVEGAERVEAPDPGRRIVHARPAAPLTVSYLVVAPSDDGLSIEHLSDYPPVIRPTWFYVIGEALFATPEGRDEAPARFDWTGGHEGLVFASDLEHLAGETRPAVRPGTVRDITHSVVLGGEDVRVLRAGGVRVAVTGHFRFTDQAILDVAARTLATQSAFWGEPPGPFLVTLAPIEGRPMSQAIQGIGRDDGFETSLTENSSLDDAVWLFAHENFHRWNNRALGGSDPEPDGAQGLWFSEGVTDFYARKLLVRSGGFTPEQFTSAWNGVLVAYAASPARAEPNSAAAAKFWSDPAFYDLAHQRGALLAALWDARLRDQSGGGTGLDDVLRAQRDAAASGRGPATRLFVEIAKAHGLDVGPDIARFITAGEPFSLPPDAFGPCATVLWADQANFDSGWDAAATRAAGQVVTRLREDSPAHRAGLRNGMTLVERLAGRPGDASVQFVVRARTASGETRTFRFFPEGTSRIRVQRVVLAAPRSPTCAASLSGLTHP